MKILLIGGAGLIGSKLSNILVSNGHNVLVLDNFSFSNRNKVNLSGELITGNANSFSILNGVFSSFQPAAIFHLADLSLDKEGNYDYNLESETSITVANNIIRCAKIYNISYVFYGSSGEVYKGGSVRPIKEESPIVGNVSYTGATKTYVENLFRLNSRMYGYKFVSFRYFNVCGESCFVNPKHDIISFFINSVLNSMPVVLVGKKTQVDVLDVYDAVKFTYNVFEKVLDNSFEFDAVNVGSGKGVLLTDLYKIVSERTVGSYVKPYIVEGEQIRTLIADVSRLKFFSAAEENVSLNETIDRLIGYKRGL